MIGVLMDVFLFRGRRLYLNGLTLDYPDHTGKDSAKVDS